MTWWWLSFCDPEKPEGERFLGVVIGEAETGQEVIRECWRRKCNPGGEVLFNQIDPDGAVTRADEGDAWCLALIKAPRWRLLSRDELAALGLEPISIGEAKEEGLAS